VGVDAWLELLHAAHSHRAEWHKALHDCGSPEAIANESQRALLARGLPEDEIARLRSPDPALLDRWRAWLDAPRRALVTIGGAHYPPRLAALGDDAPLALWVEGEDLPLLATPQLAMVGSRSPTTAGRDTAQQFAKYLSDRGLTITSGLAVGIDGASHRGALQGLSSTIAVLGGGLDSIFPRAHAELAAEIAARGVLVSEYPPGVGPQKFHFPQRNRIIAGLALGTLVVEATRRSGSLITARKANDYGREVFAIPGSIHNPLARGCHLLIRNGAKLVEEASDIFLELAPQLAIDADTARAIAGREITPDSMQRVDDPEYRKVLDLLGYSPQSISDLSGRAGLTTAELSSMLLVLELEGFVEALPGGRYSRLAKRE
jgi:DNA processing protein